MLGRRHEEQNRLCLGQQGQPLCQDGHGVKERCRQGVAAVNRCVNTPARTSHFPAPATSPHAIMPLLQWHENPEVRGLEAAICGLRLGGCDVASLPPRLACS